MRILVHMVNYAYLSLRGAPARAAAEMAGRRLAAEFPGCKAHILDEGRTRDGAEWLSVRFEIAEDASAASCLRAFSADLNDQGVAFWRVMPEQRSRTRQASRGWQPGVSAA